MSISTGTSTSRHGTGSRCPPIARTLRNRSLQLNGKRLRCFDTNHAVSHNIFELRPPTQVVELARRAFEVLPRPEHNAKGGRDQRP